MVALQAAVLTALGEPRGIKFIPPNRRLKKSKRSVSPNKPNPAAKPNGERQFAWTQSAQHI